MARNRPLIFTALNSAALFLLGMLISQKGPSFNDLILISNTDVEGGSFFVTASNFGYMMGSVVGGLLYGRIKRKTLTIAVAVMLAGVFTILTPWCSAFPAMVAIHVVVSVFSAVYETVVNAEELKAWDGSSESAMQFLSFCFSLGGVIGPLITEPFMAPKLGDISTNDSATVSGNNASTNITAHPNFSGHLNFDDELTNQPAVQCSELDTNCTSSLEGTNLSNNTNFGLPSGNDNPASLDVETRLHYAYLITGCMCLLVSLAFYATHCIVRTRLKKQKGHEKERIVGDRKLSLKHYLCVLGLICVYYYFHTMSVDSFQQYLFFFVVTHLNWTKDNGAFLVSMHWALAMCVKLVLVVIYKRLRTGAVLVFSVIGIVISLTLFTIGGYFHLHILVWISTGLGAVTQASIFGGGFAWTDSELIKLEGRETSALMISAGLGALSAPLPLGVFMKELSLMAFPYFVLCQSSISACLFLVLIFVAKPYLNSRYGPLRSRATDSDCENDTQDKMVENGCMERTEDCKTEDIEI